MNIIHTGRKETIKAELVLLAMGFTNPVSEGLLDQLGVEKDGRGNVKVDALTHATDIDGVFAAGDVASGASLVVRCIAAGRDTAAAIHNYLTKQDD